MARDLAAGFAAGIAAKVVRLAFFAEFQFASGTVRLWTGQGATSWSGETWNGFGKLAGITAVDETTEIGAAGLTFTLSGVPGDLVTLAFGDAYRGRPCKLWLARLDAADAVIDAAQIFGGRMDTMKADDSGDTASISLTAESRLIDLQRARALRFTPADQQRLYPADTGLRGVAKVAEAQIPWGVAGIASPFAAGAYTGGGYHGNTSAAALEA